MGQLIFYFKYEFNIPFNEFSYFVTVGSCSKDNCGENSVSVPYGTNTNGQTVCYKTEKNSLFSASSFGPVPGFDSCGPQLTQVTLPI